MQSIKNIVELVKELIRLTNEGLISWNITIANNDGKKYFDCENNDAKTIINNNSYSFYFGCNGKSLHMNNKLILSGNDKYNPDEYNSYLKNMNANILDQLENAITKKPTVDIVELENIVSNLKEIQSNVTMTMDGRTCVNGVPLPKELQEKLHDLIKIEVRKEIDQQIINALNGDKQAT